VIPETPFTSGGIDMTEELNFFIYLLEHYAAEKHTDVDKVLKQWDRLNLTDMYWRYHTKDLKNAYEDIDRLIKERQEDGSN